MSTFDVDVWFDTVAARWTFRRVGPVVSAGLVEVGPGAYVSRAPNGSLLELVLDTDGRRAVSGNATALLRSLVGPAATADFERRVHLDEFTITASPTASLVAPRVVVPPIIGEPGVPQRQPDGSFVIPGADGAAHLIADRSTISVVVTAGDAQDASWLVISDGTSGTLLASARLRDIGDGRRAADVTFGLPLQPEDLLVATTHDPLAPVAAREVRQAAWARSLLAEARSTLRRRPVRARRRATKAAHIASTIDDRVLRAEALHTSARATRWGIGLLVVALVALAASAGYGLSRALQHAPTPTPPPGSTVYYENCDAARAAGPTPILRGQPGYRPGLDRDNDGAACEG